MKVKIKKDINSAKGNNELIFITLVLIFMAGIIYSISSRAGGEFYDFCRAVVLWALLGIGMAFAVTWMSQNRSISKDDDFLEKNED